MGTNGSFPSPIRVWPENSWPYLVRGSNIKCWCFRNWRRNCMSWPWLTAMCLGLVGNWDHEASFRMEASADDEQLVNDLSWLLISVYIYVHIYIHCFSNVLQRLRWLARRHCIWALNGERWTWHCRLAKPWSVWQWPHFCFCLAYHLVI